MLAEPGATFARAALVAVSIVAVVLSLAAVTQGGPRRGPRFMSDLLKPPARSRLTEIVFRNPTTTRTSIDWPRDMRARLADGATSGTVASMPQQAFWQLAPTTPAAWAR